MTLKINSKAPAFTSPSTSKNNYSLKDSFGKYDGVRSIENQKLGK